MKQPNILFPVLRALEDRRQTSYMLLKALEFVLITFGLTIIISALLVVIIKVIGAVVHKEIKPKVHTSQEAK